MKSMEIITVKGQGIPWETGCPDVNHASAETAAAPAGRGDAIKNAVIACPQHFLFNLRTEWLGDSNPENFLYLEYHDHVLENTYSPTIFHYPGTAKD